MDLFIGFIAGIVLSAIVVNQVARAVIAKLTDEIEEDAKQEMQDKMFGINVEAVNGIIYCYSESDNQFVCQGATLEEIRTAFKKRFPNRVGFIAGGDPDTVAQLKKQIDLAKKDNEQGLHP